MPTKRTTMAQIQSQLEEVRFIVDRQRNEINLLQGQVNDRNAIIDSLRLQISGLLDTINKKDEHIASLHQQLEEMSKKEEPSTSAWEQIKKSWRRCDATDYYKFCSPGPIGLATARTAQKELEKVGKTAYVSTSNGKVYIAVHK